MEIFQHKNLAITFTSSCQRFAFVQYGKFLSVTPTTLGVIIALLEIETKFIIVVHQGSSSVELYRSENDLLLRFANFAAKCHGVSLRLDEECIYEIFKKKSEINYFIKYGKMIDATSYTPTPPAPIQYSYNTANSLYTSVFDISKPPPPPSSPSSSTANAPMTSDAYKNE